MKATPALELFSGWNCTPTVRPVRTMEEYKQLSGIDYRACTITDPFNGQLC